MTLDNKQLKIVSGVAIVYVIGSCIGVALGYLPLRVGVGLVVGAAVGFTIAVLLFRRRD